MSDAAGTIQSILSEHKGNLTLPDYWEIGRAVRAHLQARKRRGDATLAKLSKATGVSARFLGHAQQFCEEWDAAEVKQLSRCGLAWRHILALFPYARRSMQLRQLACQEKRPELEKQAALLDSQRRAFLRQAQHSGLRELEGGVRAWRLKHLDLWGQGDKGRWLEHARRRMKKGIRMIEEAVTEIEQRDRHGTIASEVTRLRKPVGEMKRIVSTQ